MKALNYIPALCCAVILCSAPAARAQQPWSLDSCISYAHESNISLKLSKNRTEGGQLSITEAKSGFLPTVSAGANQSWNIGRGLTSANTYANRNTSSFSYSAGMNLPVFSGLRNSRNLALAKANLSQLAEQYEAAKEDITINIITSYLQVLYNKELKEVAVQQVALSEYELSRREAMLEAGKIPEADLLDAVSQLEQDRMNLTQTTNDVTLALVDLAQLLQLNDVSGFDVLPLADENAMIIPADVAYTRALQYNHTIEAARRGITSADKSISLAKSGYLPSLSFSAGIGSSYYAVSGMQHDSFGKQMNNNFATNFGFSLSIPIFDGLQTRNQVRRAKLEKLNAELELEQSEQQLYRTIQQAYYQAVGAEKKLASAGAAQKAAEAAFTSIQEKYNLGRATPYEYEQAKTKALTTTAQQIQARYELIMRSRLLQFYSEPH